MVVKSTLEKSLMYSFMSSVLKIIRKLDISTNKSSDEVYKYNISFYIYL